VHSHHPFPADRISRQTSQYFAIHHRQSNNTSQLWWLTNHTRIWASCCFFCNTTEMEHQRMDHTQCFLFHIVVLRCTITKQAQDITNLMKKDIMALTRVYSTIQCNKVWRCSDPNDIQNLKFEEKFPRILRTYQEAWEPRKTVKTKKTDSRKYCKYLCMV